MLMVSQLRKILARLSANRPAQLLVLFCLITTLVWGAKTLPKIVHVTLNKTERNNCNHAINDFNSSTQHTDQQRNFKHSSITKNFYGQKQENVSRCSAFYRVERSGVTMAKLHADLAANGWEIVDYPNIHGYDDYIDHLVKKGQGKREDLAYDSPARIENQNRLHARAQAETTTEQFLSSWLAGTANYDFSAPGQEKYSVLQFRYRSKNNHDLVYYMTIYREDRKDKKPYNIEYFINGLPSTLFDAPKGVGMLTPARR